MQAIFGLVGVIIGALLTGLSNYLFARRKDRLAARVAARLVRDDLYAVASWVEDGITQGKWPVNVGSCIDIGIWKEQRIHIATVTEYSDYAKVAQAIVSVGRLNNWLASCSHQTINDSDKQLLNRWLGDLAEGLVVLKSLAQ
jgi:hypothetical protein